MLGRLFGRRRAPVTMLDGGRPGKKLSALPSTPASLNVQVQTYGRTLLARARYLVQNNPHAAAAKESYVGALVGDGGIKPGSLVADPGQREAINRAWLAWTDDADADGLTDFYGLQAVAAGQLFEAGECFVRFRPRLPEDGLAVPLQIELLPSEMVSQRSEALGYGRAIVQGIEFDSLGRRVAYHFLRRPPGGSTDPRVPLEDEVRVPASEVLHLFRPLQPKQVRGVSSIAPVVTRLAQLDQYDDAELDRKKTAACFAGFVLAPTPDDALNILGQDEEDKAGDRTIALRPGLMQRLLPGEEIKFSDPADVGGNYEAFLYRALLAAAAGMGVPYAAMTGDLRQTSYGSQRAGLVEFRRRIALLQHSVMIYQFVRPVWQRWLDAAVLAGVLRLPGYGADRKPFQRVRMSPPKWEWIDPKKDREAEVLAIKAGLKARSDAIEAEGYDPEEVDARIAADQERARRLGLSFPEIPNVPDQEDTD